MFRIKSGNFAAVAVLPFAAGACGPLSYDGQLVNSADPALSGCQYLEASCNDTVLSGVVAKIEGAEREELTIRFYTLTDNENGTVTYRDGSRTTTMDVVAFGEFENATSSFAFSPTMTYTGAAVGLFGGDQLVLGPIGYHTDASVIPTSGVAEYAGDAAVLTYDSGSGSGDSTLVVDFEAATADLYANLTSGDITAFDEVQSLNMQIEGYTFTGDEVVLLLADNPVNATGDNTKSASAGMFYGPVDVHGNPYEYGAVAIVSGDGDKVILMSEGAVTYP